MSVHNTERDERKESTNNTERDDRKESTNNTESYLVSKLVGALSPVNHSNTERELVS